MDINHNNNEEALKRKRWRKYATIYIFVAALIFIFLFKNKVFAGSNTPVAYLGYFLIPFGILGLFGVNIWYGGPLDKRLDKDEKD